uniref:Uncharacterized protein n=2 Tax=Candidatus Kentrum sp. FM TaxID=2126340 RepID=A0A450TYZ0_9GAMM|nr:MAG: hypothetical protein BECKFM1743C_GA0114222_108183 [Candidatus Kentron sp. FM]
MYFSGEPSSHLFHEEEYTKQGKGANRKYPDSEYGKRANEPNGTDTDRGKCKSQRLRKNLPTVARPHS